MSTPEEQVKLSQDEIQVIGNGNENTTETTPLLSEKREKSILRIGLPEISGIFEAWSAGIVLQGFESLFGINEIKQWSDYLDTRNDVSIFLQGIFGGFTASTVVLGFFLGRAYRDWSNDPVNKNKPKSVFFREDSGEAVKKAIKTVVASGLVIETFLFSSPCILIALKAFSDWLGATMVGEVVLSTSGALLLSIALAFAFKGIRTLLQEETTPTKVVQIAALLWMLGINGWLTDLIVTKAGLQDVVKQFFEVVFIPTLAAFLSVPPLLGGIAIENSKKKDKPVSTDESGILIKNENNSTKSNFDNKPTWQNRTTTETIKVGLQYVGKKLLCGCSWWANKSPGQNGDLERPADTEQNSSPDHQPN